VVGKARHATYKRSVNHVLARGRLSRCHRTHFGWPSRAACGLLPLLLQLLLLSPVALLLLLLHLLLLGLCVSAQWAVSEHVCSCRKFLSQVLQV
jgi:hypothetical protein